MGIDLYYRFYIFVRNKDKMKKVISLRVPEELDKYLRLQAKKRKVGITEHYRDCIELGASEIPNLKKK